MLSWCIVSSETSFPYRGPLAIGVALCMTCMRFFSSSREFRFKVTVMHEKGYMRKFVLRKNAKNNYHALHYNIFFSFFVPKIFVNVLPLFYRDVIEIVIV